MRHFVGGRAGERVCAPQWIRDGEKPDRFIKDHKDHDRQPSQRSDQPEDRQRRVCRPDAKCHRLGVIPRSLVVDDRRPRLNPDANEHQEIKQSQKVNVDRANALVFFVIRREDIFYESHTPEFTRGIAWMFQIFAGCFTSAAAGRCSRFPR